LTDLELLLLLVDSTGSSIEEELFVLVFVLIGLAAELELELFIMGVPALVDD